MQLIGDRSEIKALDAYQALQKKHEAILGEYQPTIVRTTLKTTAAAIWTRIRIEGWALLDADRSRQDFP